MEVLHELWLNDNFLTKIDGLNDCKQLKALYICNNEIAKIANLSHLKLLETLWLVNNKITVMEGITGLKKLKQLCLQGNMINCIKDDDGAEMEEMRNLSEVNLAANMLCDFKYILVLSQLPNVRVLAFQDSQHGENPLVNLGHYQQFVIKHFPLLFRLDQCNITEEQKFNVEMQFLKKSLYYSLQKQNIKRVVVTLNRVLQYAKECKLDMLDQNLISMLLVMEELKHNTHNNSTRKDESDALQMSISSLLPEQYEKIKQLDSLQEEMQALLMQQQKSAIAILNMENKSASNVRLLFYLFYKIIKIITI